MLQIDELGFAERRMFHGGIVQVPQRILQSPVGQRLQRISAATLKPELNADDVTDIMACVRVLRDAGNI